MHRTYEPKLVQDSSYFIIIKIVLRNPGLPFNIYAHPMRIVALRSRMPIIARPRAAHVDARSHYTCIVARPHRTSGIA